jgi:hypothetical protein
MVAAGLQQPGSEPEQRGASVAMPPLLMHKSNLFLVRIAEVRGLLGEDDAALLKGVERGLQLEVSGVPPLAQVQNSVRYDF